MGGGRLVEAGEALRGGFFQLGVVSKTGVSTSDYLSIPWDGGLEVPI
jgi:hypothetical protein